MSGTNGSGNGNGTALRLAAIYARVSTEDQAKNFSIETQIETCRKLADREGYTVPKSHVLIDAGLSGTTMDRPALRALRELVKTQATRAVVVYDVDRLSRNQGHLLLLLEEFEQVSITLLDRTGPVANTPEGTLLFSMRGAVAQYERAKMMQRSQDGRLSRAKAGNPWGGQVPLGYTAIREPHKARWEIDEEEAALVRRIFHMSLSGMTMHAIARQLTREELPTRYDRHPRGGGRKLFQSGVWELSSIYKILTNEAYTGHAYWGKYTHVSKTRRVLRPRDEWIEIPVPAIIDEGIFRAVQERLARNKVWRKQKYEYLLRGRFRCGRCGRAMTGCAPDGVRYYRCNSLCTVPERERRCRGHVRADEVEGQVWQAVERVLQDPALIAAEVTRQHAHADQAREEAGRTRASIAAVLATCDREEQRWAKAYAAEVIDLEELKGCRAEIARRRQELLAEQATVDARLKSLEGMASQVDALVAYCVQVRETLRTAETAEKQRVFEALAIQVTWTPGMPPAISGGIPLNVTDFIPLGCGKNSFTFCLPV